MLGEEQHPLVDIDIDLYDREGFFIYRDYVSTKTLGRLRKWVEEIPRSAPLSEGLETYREDPLSELSEIRLVENFCGFHRGLNELSQSLASVAGQYFKEPAVLFKDKINYKYPGGQGYKAHRDGRFWWRDQDGKRMPGWWIYASEFLNAALFLDDATEDNGCLEVAPGMHTLDAVGKKFDPLTTEQASSMEFVPIPLNAGDVILFDALLPHRSGMNRTDAPRRAVYFTYNRLSEGDHRGRYFRDKAISINSQGRHRFYR